MRLYCIIGFLLTCASRILSAGETPAVNADAGYDLYLLIGQSNMAGRGKVDDESKQSHPRVFVLNKENQWAPAVDPLHFDKPIAAVGPGLAFGKAMADANPQAKIGLIPCAVGGSSILAWAPGAPDAATKTHPYDDTLRRVRIALRSGTLKGILWHQGESDRATGVAATYGEKLTELIARLRKEFNAPDVPFVAGELGLLNEQNTEVTQNLNTILHSLTKTVKNYDCVSASGLKDHGDKLHFDSASAREFGKRYAEAMRKLQGVTGK